MLFCVYALQSACVQMCAVCMKDILAAKTYSTLQHFVAFLVFVVEFFEIEQDTAIYIVFYSLPHKTPVFSDCFPDGKWCPSSAAYHHPHQLSKSTPHRRHSSGLKMAQDVQSSKCQVKRKLKCFGTKFVGKIRRRPKQLQYALIKVKSTIEP